MSLRRTAEIGEILRRDQTGPSSAPQPELYSEEQPGLKRKLKKKIELPVRRLLPRKCKSESNNRENAANIGLDGYAKGTVVEFSICDPGLAASIEGPPNLHKIIDEISCQANTARDFIFQIRTSDVEECVDVSRRVGDVRTFLQILNIDKLQGFKNIIDDSVLMSSNFQQTVNNLFSFNWMEKEEFVFRKQTNSSSWIFGSFLFLPPIRLFAPPPPT